MKNAPGSESQHNSQHETRDISIIKVPTLGFRALGFEVSGRGLRLQVFRLRSSGGLGLV